MRYATNKEVALLMAELEAKSAKLEAKIAKIETEVLLLKVRKSKSTD